MTADVFEVDEAVKGKVIKAVTIDEVHAEEEADAEYAQIAKEDAAIKAVADKLMQEHEKDKATGVHR